MSTSNTSSEIDDRPADRILTETRVVAALFIPFLVLAFLILFLYPQESARRFAWPIDPDLMAMYIGAGYLGGAYLCAHTPFRPVSDRA